ncbi:MAG: DUF1015 domain-containing protein [Desulfomonilaceae bacterium]
MALIKAFPVVKYGRRLTNELEKLITPPYDVISPQEQQAFYESHPFNMIRLVLGNQYPDDHELNNKHTRAASTLDEWMRKGVLTRHGKPALVIYQMDFEQPGVGVKRLDGIVAVVKVDDYGRGKVLPHEKTYLGPKKDQLDLLRACKSNLTPVHSLFDDDDDRIYNLYSPYMENEPDQVTTDSNKNVHRTWLIDDEKIIDAIIEAFDSKSLFIADGHHRYETALAYKREQEALDSYDPEAPYNYVMMYLTALSHPGLTILPAHRMVKGLSNFEISKFFTQLDPYFDFTEIPFSECGLTADIERFISGLADYSEFGGCFGMACHGQNRFWLLKLKDFGALSRVVDSSIPVALQRLDVTILSEVIMNLGLGLDKGNSEGKIEYTPIMSEAIERALRGEVQASFILNPTRVDQMREAAEKGFKLPQKSTYIYPKLSSGLVLNVFQ